MRCLGPPGGEGQECRPRSNEQCSLALHDYLLSSATTLVPLLPHLTFTIQLSRRGKLFLDARPAPGSITPQVPAGSPMSTERPA